MFTGCASSSVAEEQIVSSRLDPSVALEKGARLFTKRVDIANARKAVETLAKARDPEKRNFELEWKFARYNYFIGSRKEIDGTQAEKHLKSGFSAALIAKRLKPDRPEGHFWYGAILGEQSKRSPVIVGIPSVDKIREAMNTVIKIDPMYQSASAFDALGQLEMKTRGISGGSVEKAIEFFEKALELDDDNSYTQLHIGEAYLAAGRKGEAKKHLQRVLSMKVDPEYVAEHAESSKDAKKLLETKF